MSATATAPVTAEELLALGDDFRGELVRGELVPMSPTGATHSEVALTIAVALRRYAKETGLGRAFGENLGYVIARNPDTVRAPDASFLLANRLPAKWPDGFIEAVPDVAVEVRSPSDRLSELLAKTAHYLEMGTRLVWIVDPSRRQVFEYRADGDARELAESDTLDGGDVLPGFTLPVAELCEGLPPPAPPAPAV